MVFVREHRYGEGDDELWAVSVESKEKQRLLRLPTLPAQENQFRSPAWSPDGRRIAFFRASGERTSSMRLWTMNADGSYARPLAAKARTGGDVTWAGDLSWSPDGEALVFDGQAEGASLYVFDLAEGRARLLTDGGWPAWSPDGSRIAYFMDTSAGWEEGWTLMAVGPEGGDERPVQGAGPASFYAYQELDWVCM